MNKNKTIFLVFLCCIGLALVSCKPLSEAEKYDKKLVAVQSKTYQPVASFSQLIGKYVYTTEEVYPEEVEKSYATILTSFEDAKKELEALEVPLGVVQAQEYKDAVAIFFDKEEKTAIVGSLLQLKKVFTDANGLTRQDKIQRIQEIIDSIPDQEKVNIEQLDHVREAYLAKNGIPSSSTPVENVEATTPVLTQSMGETPTSS